MVEPSDNNTISNSRTEEVTDENTGINRREYLQFAGLASLPFVAAGAASKTARADASGYGVSGYGGSGYGANSGSGGSTDLAPAVSTLAPTAVDETSAVLNGIIDDLGGASTVTASFEYRQLGTADWQRTPAVEHSSPGEVTRTVTGLDAGTDYEYRTLATDGSNTVRADTASQFTTTADTSGGDSDASVELSNTIIFDGSETNLSSYAFSVSGEVERVDALTTANGSDWYFSPADDRAVGMLGDGQHGYRYSGRITSLQISGNATARLDP